MTPMRNCPSPRSCQQRQLVLADIEATAEMTLSYSLKMQSAVLPTLEKRSHAHAQMHLLWFFSLCIPQLERMSKQDRRGSCRRVTGVDVRCHERRRIPLMFFLLLSAGCLTDEDLGRKTQTGQTLGVVEIFVAWRESADAKSEV